MFLSTWYWRCRSIESPVQAHVLGSSCIIDDVVLLRAHEAVSGTVMNDAVMGWLVSGQSRVSTPRGSYRQQQQQQELCLNKLAMPGHT